MNNTAKKSVSVIAIYLGKDYNLSRIPASSALTAKHRVMPLKVLTHDGDKIIIDRVTDVRRQASTKAGGLGERYTCLATLGEQQREIYVYKDEDDWYMEEEF